MKSAIFAIFALFVSLSSWLSAESPTAPSPVASPQSLSPPTEIANPWEAGIAALEDGDSAGAVKSFSEQIARGQIGAEVYYHLGLAEAAAGNITQASIAFHRALLIDPTLAPARAELKKLAEKAGFALPPAGRTRAIVSRVGAGALWVWGSVLGWSGLLILLISVLSAKKKAAAVWCGAVIFLAGATMHAIAWFGDPLIADRELMVVQTASPLPLRGAPVDTAAAIERLPAGAAVERLAQRGRWTHVATASGKRGWLPSEHLLPVLPNGGS
jgi:tetratricopeptide (TPR) repeat protein